MIRVSIVRLRRDSSRLRCLLNYRSTRSITVVSTLQTLYRLEVRFFPVLDESVGFSSLHIASS